MPGIEEDLRATSDAILADARTLTALEETKRPIDPADPALVPVSKEIERLAGRLVQETAVERSLAMEIRGEPNEGAPD
jgi:hypothetical protein